MYVCRRIIYYKESTRVTRFSLRTGKCFKCGYQSSLVPFDPLLEKSGSLSGFLVGGLD